MTEQHSTNACQRLEYSVSGYSSFSNNYHPKNITENKPNDQSSRWSSDSNNPPQFLTLKLSQLSIVHTITFGKYEKAHVCNLRKFKVYGGLEDNNMIELLDGGLKNDNKFESFGLRYTIRDQAFACRYIKIVPLQSWGLSFNFTIWYVELTGSTEPKTVTEAVQWFSVYRKTEAIRLCLKFLREMNLNKTFDSLREESSVALEHPSLTDLYQLVISGDYLQAEEFMDTAVSNGMLNQYMARLEYKPDWENLSWGRPGVQCEGRGTARPGVRGGHQMCLDPPSETVYLFGGWDGHQDLCDFWSYHIPTNTWSLISQDTSAEGGPGPRSCHKLCIDVEQRQIFVLGRYVELPNRRPDVLKSDFYVYSLESNEWLKLSDDTGKNGGPELIFDHQMCIDSKNRTIYVFGGRVVLPMEAAEVLVASNADAVYSGLYSYHIPTDTWTVLKHNNDSSLQSRVGHSMLFHSVRRKLYIFAGQKNKGYLSDLMTYDVDSGQVDCITDPSTTDLSTLPSSGFTQRATIDSQLDEIYVFSVRGLSKDKDRRDDCVHNSFWIYYIKENKWNCIYKNENASIQYWNKMRKIEPCPRFAHQLVYDPIKKVHYLFGGNPGMSCLPRLRLDDFWKLDLVRTTNEQIRRKCKILIRKYRYMELAKENKCEAMSFLQTQIFELVNHMDPNETTQFQGLAMVLFQSEVESNPTEEKFYELRTKLFEELSHFFPEGVVQPKSSLFDVVPL